MNAKRVLKAGGEALETAFIICNPLNVFRWQSAVALALVGIALVSAKSTDDLLPSERPTLDHVKPVNSPSFETHRAEASAVCRGPVLKPGKETPSPWVVVVKNNGDVVKMATQEAWDRSSDKNRVNHVWTIGVCKKHVEKN